MYPINLRLEGRRCAVIGGGRVARRKAFSLLSAGAELTIISPDILPELASLASQGKICWRQQAFSFEQVKGFFLIVCATDSLPVNRAAALAAKAAGVLVNVSAPAELSDFYVPAHVSRGDFLLTVSTGGISPAFSRQVRQKLMMEFAESYGLWLARLRELRARLKEKDISCKEREVFWRRNMNEHILDLVSRGELEQAEAEIKNAIDGLGIES